jgi:hypothetical protein
VVPCGRSLPMLKSCLLSASSGRSILIALVTEHFRNVGYLLPHYTMQQPRSQPSSNIILTLNISGKIRLTEHSPACMYFSLRVIGRRQRRVKHDYCK